MIDEKGRLFGKINIIDLAVVLVIVLLAGGILYREKGSSAVVAQPRTVVMKVVCLGVYPDAATQIKPGDQLVASGNLVPVYVKDVKIRRALNGTPNAEGQIILAEHPFRKDVLLTLEGKTMAVSPAEIVLGGQRVRAGIEDYVVKTQKFEAKATIISVEVK